MKDTYYIGIDVGDSGAIGVINSNKQFVDLMDMPIMTWQIEKKVTRGKHKGEKKKYTRRKMMPLEVKNIFEKYKNEANIIVIIEHQQVFPKQGAVSGAKIVGDYNMLMGICIGMNIKYFTPKPREWKNAMLGYTAKDKAASIIAAQQAFPEAKLIPEGSKKVSDGRAESLLIALYGLERFS